MRECTIDGCAKPSKARGLCDMHRKRRERYGDPLARYEARTDCMVEECESPHRAKGYCEKHYRKFLKYGDPLAGPGRGDWGHGSYRKAV